MACKKKKNSITFTHYLKIIFPATRSRTATLLRLHPNHWLLLNYVKVFEPSQLSASDGRCVQGQFTYSPWRSDSRLLVIPASWGRVSVLNPNLGNFWNQLKITFLFRSVMFHCSTCVAQPIGVTETWLRSSLPAIYHCRSSQKLNPLSVLIFFTKNWEQEFRPLTGFNQTFHNTDLRQSCNTCDKV